MRKICVVGIGVLVLVLYSSPAFAQVDSFILAIQHFDPEHKFGVEYLGEEHRFVVEAMFAAGDYIPEVATIRNQTSYRGSWSDLTEVSTLRLTGFRARYSQRDSVSAVIERIASRIGAGCLAERTVKTVEGRNGTQRKSSKTIWDFGRFCDEDYEDRFCENIDVVDWLCSNGVSGIQSESSAENKSIRSDLYLLFNPAVDLIYAHRQLVANPLFSEVFEGYGLKPFQPQFSVDVPEVVLISDPKYEGFKGLKLKYIFRHGDYPYGGALGHFWLIEVRAVGKSAEGSWEFKLRLVEEGGDVLPEYLRDRLRCPGRYR